MTVAASGTESQDVCPSNDYPDRRGVGVVGAMSVVGVTGVVGVRGLGVGSVGGCRR